MFKKQLLCSVVAASLSFSAFSVKADEEGEAASIAELILDKAKDKFVSQAGSLLIDAIFGSGGEQFVSLSEASLQAIQDRVREELVRTAEFEFLAEFESLEASMNYYSDTVDFGNPDEAVLAGLFIKGNDLVNHHALNDDFNEDYYYMADSYSIAASLALSIYVERNLLGFIGSNSVSSIARTYADRLEDMVEAKKEADWPLYDYCYDPDTTDQDIDVKCRLKDPHGNTIALDSFDPRDSYDRESWEEQIETATAVYYEDKFGKLEDVIADLNNF